MASLDPLLIFSSLSLFNINVKKRTSLIDARRCITSNLRYFLCFILFVVSWYLKRDLGHWARGNNPEASRRKVQPVIIGSAGAADETANDTHRSSYCCTGRALPSVLHFVPLSLGPSTLKMQGPNKLIRS